MKQPLRALLLFVGWVCCSSSLAQKIAINEIRPCAAVLSEPSEYIELYNADAESVDLSGWSFSQGIDFVFPAGTSLPKGGYLLVAQNPDSVRRIFSLTSTSQVLGPYRGKLRTESERIELRNAQNVLVDAVEYKRGFPYPTLRRSSNQTLQLMHPELDNSLAGHWRTAAPSPGAANQAVLVADRNAPPAISRVRHLPQSPRANQPVTVSARIQDPQGVAYAELLYQTVDAGAYIRKKDAAFENTTNWKSLPMFDNGQNGDSIAGDGIYSIQIPAAIQKHRRLVRYRIVALDSSTRRVQVPYKDDPQPNFAYFAYDGLPKYAGYSFDSLRPMPVLQLIAKGEDVSYAIQRYNGDDYPVTGTLVYNGQVFDHIYFRSRGYRNRHARPKRNLKFNLHAGHEIELLDNYMRPSGIKRGKFLLSGTWLLDKPNTHGIAEMVLYKFFTLQNAPATTADFLQLRVVDSQVENDTLGGDFWGVYLAMENFDGDFLRTHGLPDGNIYSYKPFKLRHPGDQGPFGAENPAFREWDTLCQKKNTLGWWTGHLNLDAYFGFLVAQEAVNNRETGYRKQHWWMEYYNPVAKNWAIFPWDMDMTWRSTAGTTTISSGIRNAAFQHAPIRIGYENKLRSFLDLLYNEEQGYALIDECASFIYNPKARYSYTDLDKLRWRQNYTSFANEVTTLKRFLSARRLVLLGRLPKTAPNQPAIQYVGASGYPADGLVFECSNFADSSGQAFAAMQWRIAEVTPAHQTRTHLEPRRYEIAAVWESADLTSFEPRMTIPAGVVQPGKTYRARVRLKNALGYYSHWSAPIEFAASAPKTNANGQVLITEILYNPAENSEVEFVELKNMSGSDLDMEGFQFADGIEFAFPKHFILAPDQRVVLANDLEKFKKQYGFEPAGVFKGNLSNSGELLRLVDAYGELVDSVRYSDKGDWDKNADGTGLSLELLPDQADNDRPEHWKASRTQGGTPQANATAPAPNPDSDKKAAAPAELRDGDRSLWEKMVIGSGIAGLLGTAFYLWKNSPSE